MEKNAFPEQNGIGRDMNVNFDKMNVIIAQYGALADPNLIPFQRVEKNGKSRNRYGMDSVDQFGLENPIKWLKTE